MTAALLVNRPITPLKAPWSHSDVAFGAERLDGVVIDMGIFFHCTFANVSFKGSQLNDSHFIDCSFVACYFRKTDIKNCKFDGCRFVDCDFPKVRVQSTSFTFPRFRNCFIDFDEFEPNLPSEPGLRAAAAAELGREAYALGATQDARRYRIVELRAHENHLWRAFRASSSYYKSRFDSVARLGAGGRWVGSQLNRLIWGNGERGLALLRTFLLLVLLLFPLLFSVTGGVEDPNGQVTTLDYMLLSVDAVTNFSGLSSIEVTETSSRVVAAIEVALGLVLFGLFITLVFRRITRWR